MNTILEALQELNKKPTKNVAMNSAMDDDEYFEIQQPKEAEALKRLSDELGLKVEIEGQGDFGEFFAVLADDDYIDDNVYDSTLINRKSVNEIYNVIKGIIKKARPDLFN